MRYKEAFYRDELEDLEETLRNVRSSQKQMARQFVEGDKGNRKFNEFEFERKYDRSAKNIVLNAKNEAEKFNILAYKEIENVTKNMGPSLYNRFDNYATGFGVLAEEFVKAKNTTEILTVMKIYNAGKLDDLFSTIKNQQDEKEEQPEDNRDNQSIHDNPNANSVLPEVNEPAHAATEPTRATDKPDGHEQVGELPNGQLQQEYRDGRNTDLDSSI